MKQSKLRKECILCLLDGYINDYPQNASEDKILLYMQSLLKILSETEIYESAPETVEKINRLQENIFGRKKDFTQINKHFNSLMLSKENDIESRIRISSEPIKTAIRYATVGNFIDFGTIRDITDEKVNDMLKKAESLNVDNSEYDMFLNDLKSSKNITYITDNCGEIVFDKIFIKLISEMYPKIKFKVIVRGYPVLNDATKDDAIYVGIDKYSDIIPNGLQLAGTALNRIDEKAKEAIDKADIIISKGQGNFETLFKADKNIYYIFMYKCKMLSEKFNVPLYTEMFINDKRAIL